MFKQLIQSVPVSFRIAWCLGVAVSLGLVGFVVWAIYRVVTAYT